jgi:hypothetical protein
MRLRNHSVWRGAVGSARSQRGSVYLGYVLLAFLLLVAGALLVKVHEVFALLLPIGVLVFFLPNLMALFAWWQAGRRFRKRLAETQGGKRQSVVVLKNESGGIDAQAVWLDTSCRELGLISDNDDGSVRTWDTLNSVRAVYAEKSYAHSFHEGKVRIPARYVLIFEFKDARPIELTTRRRRVMDRWLEVLHPHFGEQLSLGITGSS